MLGPWWAPNLPPRLVRHVFRDLGQQFTKPMVRVPTGGQGGANQCTGHATMMEPMCELAEHPQTTHPSPCASMSWRGPGAHALGRCACFVHPHQGTCVVVEHHFRRRDDTRTPHKRQQNQTSRVCQKGHDLGAWLWAMALAHGRSPMAMPMGGAHGRCKRGSRSPAGQGPWALAHGPWPRGEGP